MKGGRRQAPRRSAYAGERPSTRARICKLAERAAARSAEAAASTATLIADESADLRRVELEAQPLDFEKPGPAQHYCVECAKYYETNAALTSHWHSKVHKQRCKQLKEPAYTIEESKHAAGLGRAERKPPTVAAVMEDVVLAT
ncbi:hypothetical protein DFH08DRAFT_816491 [Mycena albidolilacea]|uniref:C2H2-type domain-containing protein n=1 Tax=Mycena albidolilacea TaxID=1033008 RepID=A0AAD6ZL69_9AGAR|nr:hypothetical protein DFH08DRAFT_816491 [Mycena albidolilacea]